MCTCSIGKSSAVELEVLAAREDRLRRALADDAILPVGRPDDDRHDAPLEVEGNLVHLGVVRDLRMMVRLAGVREHGAIHHVLEARLEVTVEIRQRQHAVVRLQDDVAVRARGSRDPS